MWKSVVCFSGCSPIYRFGWWVLALFNFLGIPVISLLPLRHFGGEVLVVYSIMCYIFVLPVLFSGYFKCTFHILLTVGLCVRISLRTKETITVRYEVNYPCNILWALSIEVYIALCLYFRCLRYIILYLALPKNTHRKYRYFECVNFCKRVCTLFVLLV